MSNYLHEWTIFVFFWAYGTSIWVFSKPARPILVWFLVHKDDGLNLFVIVCAMQSGADVVDVRCLHVRSLRDRKWRLLRDLRVRRDLHAAGCGTATQWRREHCTGDRRRGVLADIVACDEANRHLSICACRWALRTTTTAHTQLREYRWTIATTRVTVFAFTTSRTAGRMWRRATSRPTRSPSGTTAPISRSRISPATITETANACVCDISIVSQCLNKTKRRLESSLKRARA